MIRPIAIVFEGKKTQSINLERTDLFQKQIIEVINNLQDTIFIKHLDFSTLNQDDTDKYNDLVFLQNWFVKTYSLESELMPFYYHQKITALAKKYEVENFVMSVYISTPKAQALLLRSQMPNSNLKKEREKILEGSDMDWEKHLLELLSKQN